jgi:uncharacterized protein YgiM (DUF1202 family)
MGLLLAVSVLSLAWAAGADVYYARKSMSLKSKPGLGAEVVGQLAAEDKVTVLDKSNARYWLVQAEAVKGYAYAKSLTQSEGVDVQSALQKMGEQDARLVDLRPDGAIRGLTEEAEAFAKAANVPPQVKQDLEWLGQIGFSPARFEAFLKAGRLGEYGGQ